MQGQSQLLRTATIILCFTSALFRTCSSQPIDFLGQPPFTAYVSRAAPPGSVVYTFIAINTTNSRSDGVSYTLVEGSRSLFEMNSHTGSLIIQQYLPLQSWLVVVQAELHTESVTAELRVNVIPEYNTNPVFEQSEFSFRPSEYVPVGASFAVVRAFSLDPATTDHSYSIISGNSGSDLTINATTGVLSVARELDYERVSSYNLSVQYSDSGAEVSVGVEVLVRDENDNAPVFSEVLYEASLSELQAAGTSVLSVLATDRDSAENGDVEYSIIGSGTSSFAIDSTLGELCTTGLLDYEQESMYSLTVVVRDRGTPAQTSTVIVLVTVLNEDDECPLFESLYYLVIREMPVSVGVELLTVQAIDPDSISSVTYAIVSGGQPEALQLDTETGVIMLISVSANTYSLNISANDASCTDQSFVQIDINIGSSNDHSPQFEGSCEGEIEENAASGTEVITLTATDRDTGVYGNLSYAFSEGSDLFRIDRLTGIVTVLSLDREDRSFHIIGVTVTDGGNKQAYCLLNITVLDVNDNVPALLTSTYEVRVPPNASPGTYVVQVIAEDPDEGVNGEIQYAISGPLSSAFEINSSSGVITIASSLTEALYSFTVTATDGGSPSMSSSSNIVVHLESSIQLPLFNQSLYRAVVCENVPFSTQILQVHSSLPNTHYNLITGSEYYTNGASILRIDSEGSITGTSQGPIDYERLPESRFLFSVRGQNTEGVTLGISTVEIELLDEDDNPPIFQSQSQDGVHANISENMPVGALVTQLIVTDLDSGINGDIFYEILGGGDKFEVLPNGEVKTLIEFDAEASPITTVNVKAFNSNPTNNDDPCLRMRESASVLIRVSVLDVNDNPPSFIEPISNLSLPENTTQGTAVYNFVATDPDTSDLEQLGYTITDGDTDSSFSIDRTGALLLVQPLDYEERSTFTLTVQVSDGIHFASTSLTISVTDVDDEPPQFDALTYTGSVLENAPVGTSILQVSVVDVDTAAISYWLTGPAEGRLAVSSSGDITVIGTIDREEFQDGVISFLAVAQGGITATASVTITIVDVNDCVPRFMDVSITPIQENVTPDSSGVFAGTVLATDLDSEANGEITYTLLQGGEQGFAVDAETGDITAHAMYDREETPFYTLVIAAVDMGTEIQLSSTISIRVMIGDVNDNAPFFPFHYVFTRILESSNIGTEVIQMPAVDLDEGANAALTYTLVAINPPEMKFSIESGTGIVTLAGSLDYEIPLQRVFNLTISVADPSSSAAADALLQIDLLDRNDHSPVLSTPSTPLGTAIAETTPVGMVVLEVEASDGDSGVNAQVVFSILSGDPNGDFLISAADGTATVSTTRQLDYETTASYDLVIQACDLGTPSHCTTSATSISINNVNDVAPSFSQTLYEGNITENAGPVSSILQVVAMDPDFGDSFEYKIESGNSGGNFSLNSTSGVLSSMVALDREEQEQYVLVITAADSGASPLSGTGTIIITVLDVDDNAPAETSQWQMLMLLLDGHLPAGELVSIYFSDPDSTYTFTGCTVVEVENTAGIFSVDPGTCNLRLVQASPPEDSYGLGVIQGDPAISSRVDIEVIHISHSEIPTKYLVTISLAMSAANFLDAAFSSFQTILSSILETDRITIYSIQDGHDPTTTVDVSFTAQTADNSYLHPTFTIQALYTMRDALESNVFQLSALPTDPCASEPCINQANCMSLTTVKNSSLTARSPSFVLFSPTVELSFECECVPGTSGQDCSINFDDCYSDPCQYGAECIDEVNGFRCVCPTGTSGVDCSVTPDECSSSPCQNGATCENVPATHICHCVPGYYGPECQYHYFKTAPTCDSILCRNGGTCSPGRDSFTCLCPDGYSGQLCELEVVLQGGCIGNPCYNGSTCTNSPSGPVCACSVGFTGPFCRWPIDNCELDLCHNGGTCATGLYGSYQCYCPPPYTGQNCEDFIPGCESSPCQNSGRCSDTSEGGYTCECTRGYYGDTCEYSVQPQDLCSDNPCISGDCTYGRDSYTCTCPATHSGDHCENAAPPSTLCDSNPCRHGGVCMVDGVNYTCSCSPGFSGTNCETDIDDCESDPCQDGVCLDGINGFLCECSSEQITGYNCNVVCPEGQTGDFCEITVQQCQSDGSPCQNGGTCIESLGSYSCVCPPTHTGPLCEQQNTCDAVQCSNGGTCSALPDGGFGCYCSDGFDGPNCELLTVSFTRSSSSSSDNSYRAYPSLQQRGQGLIQFQFSTLDSDGLLLYNTQLQAGASRDYIAVEVSGGRLVVGVSQGEEGVRPVLMSVAAVVDDGQWHNVTIQTSGKTLSVTLDFCHDLDTVTAASAGCYVTADTQGQSSFLDLGLPLWLGGVPPSLSPSPSHVSNTGITACVSQVYIAGRLLDLNSHLDQRNSQPGCPPLESQCVSGECGGGTCVATWSTALCACPPLLSGDLCDVVSLSLTYTGSGYAHYSLTEEGARQRRQAGGILRSTYRDVVSLSLRTTHTDGSLFHMQDSSGSEYLYIQLESGQVELHLNLGSGQETVLVASEHLVNDSQRHSMTVARTGLDLTLTVDSHTLQHSLAYGTPLTLEIDSSEIYTGGSPYATTSFVGCLQDVRIDQFDLPTSGSNSFASVEFEGSEDGLTSITAGCNLSPCFPSPCGSGVCEEMNNSSFQCVCSNGVRMASICPQPQDKFQYTPYIIGGAVLGVLLVFFIITLSAGVCYWQRRRKRRTYLIGAAEKAGSQDLAELFTPSQALVISNEQGGGEEDTAIVDWSPLTTKRKSITQASPASSRASSKGSQASKGSRASRSSHTSRGSRSKRRRYQVQLPIHEKEEVDGDENVRSNSPVIRAYLQERVDTANEEVKSVDSIREFCEEGSDDDSESAESLSSLGSGLSSDEEDYTVERLRAAGPPLSSLAHLLEHVLHSGENSIRDSSSDIL